MFSVRVLDYSDEQDKTMLRAYTCVHFAHNACTREQRSDDTSLILFNARLLGAVCDSLQCPQTAFRGRSHNVNARRRVLTAKRCCKM